MKYLYNFSPFFLLIIGAMYAGQSRLALREHSEWIEQT